MWIQGQVVERIDWNRQLFTLKIKADLAPFIAGQFIKLSQKLDGRRISRAYSLVNSPGSDYLEVLVIAVEGGRFSSKLHLLSAGDPIEITAAATGFLTLAELPKALPPQTALWLLATGTGVGPFISMLGTAEPWQRFSKIVLVYGVRRSQDLAYFEKLQALAASYPDKFILVCSITRESVPGAFSERIPDLLTRGLLEKKVGLSLTPQLSQVMLCGNPDMITDSVKALNAKGLVKNLRRAPGQITLEKYW